MTKLNEKTFTDKNGHQLIVRHRKSAIFFLKHYKDDDLKKHPTGGIYIDGAGLACDYYFTDDTFKELYNYLIAAGNESWKDLNPREIDSFGAEYDEYYDKEFDNNGSLGVGWNCILIQGPYAQPPNKEHITRLIKFNKRKFESFMYDFKNNCAS